MTAINGSDSTTFSNDDGNRFICPICDSAFLPGQSNRLHGFFHRGSDDVLIAVLCNTCSKNFSSLTVGYRYRQLLRERIESRIRRFVNGEDDCIEKIAITTEKVLIQNNLDIHLALRRGWTLSEPRNSFYVIRICGKPALAKITEV